MSKLIDWIRLTGDGGVQVAEISVDEALLFTAAELERLTQHEAEADVEEQLAAAGALR